MKIIRNKTFETNSSSTHAITIPRNNNDISKLPRIYFGISDFGWEYAKYDLKDYIWTAICDCYPNDYEEYKNKLIELLTPYYEVIEFQEPEFDESYDDEGNLKWRYLSTSCGYVDHCDELKEFLEDILNNENLLLDALRCGYVDTGNDNCDIEVGCITNDGYDCYTYYKGN